MGEIFMYEVYKITSSDVIARNAGILGGFLGFFFGALFTGFWFLLSSINERLGKLVELNVRNSVYQDPPLKKKSESEQFMNVLNSHRE